ncbi:hypothetical protein B0A52_02040 [Exophiala mesophila]|uniref:Uncharacterized protein n=1 Tax=Exophiala mesophila TaxID=212818 RepID=A0A438NEQ3_EXOME|nr:hypothetical protein B0A52_02040 [Exophiala mesophila]
MTASSSTSKNESASKPLDAILATIRLNLSNTLATFGAESQQYYSVRQLMHEYLIENLRSLDQESATQNDGREEVKTPSEELMEANAESSFQAIEDEVLKLMSELSLRLVQLNPGFPNTALTDL